MSDEQWTIRTLMAPASMRRRGELLAWLREPGRGSVSAYQAGSRCPAYRDQRFYFSFNDMARRDLLALERDGRVRRLDTAPMTWEAIQ